MWMKLEQEKESNIEKNKTESSLLKCPICKGRGYFEPSQVPTLSNSNNLLFKSDNKNPLKLPQLGKKSNSKQLQKFHCKYSLPSINNVNSLTKQRSPDRLDSNSATQNGLINQKDFQKLNQNNLEEFGTQRIQENFNIVRPQRSSIVSSRESYNEDNLIPSPATPNNPTETLKTCLAKIKSTNWNDSVTALKEIVQLSRFHPQILEPSMTIVYRGLIFLLKSFRSIVVRIACQAANELFATMANTQRPEFDEVVSNLLQRTADTNKGIRQDANEALDTMILNVPFNHSIRAIMNKGVSQKSPLIRSAAARLFVCVVGVVGIDTIFSGNKEIRGRIISSGASFLQDGNQEVRNFGKRLMKMLMRHDDFDEVLQAEVSEVTMKRIEKALITMKYKT